MVWMNRGRSLRQWAVPATIGVFGIVLLGGRGVGAQVSPTGVGGETSATGDQNCAVTTARIGTVDVTEFFGVRGGAAGFRDSFAAPASQAPSSEPFQTPVQRCIRLEVENPTPGDLVPVGGYVLGGFAFDPTAGPNQGSGIRSIQVFLDDPNQGGSVVGESSAGSGTSSKGFGLASPRGAAFGDQFANSGFQMTVQIPSSAAGSPHALFVVALSSAGRVGTVALPVVVGNLTPAVPTRTP
jgi:hypothetical protein